MKKIIFNIILFSLLLTVSSCEKDFLDAKPTDVISTDQLEEASKLNPDLQLGTLRGVYATMYTQGSGGTTGHDDFGQKGYDIFTDLLSSDMALAGATYGWYTNLARLNATQDFTSNTNYQPWRYYYRIILGANIVIDGLGGNDVDVADLNEGGKSAMGQAKALRAYAYFYLVNLFTKEYAPNELALPIYDNAVDADNKPLSTQEDVYKLIVKDLTDAEALLANFTRAEKNEVDIWVVKGLLSYVYGAMGDYSNAATVTNEIISSSPFTISDSTSITKTISNPDNAGFNNIDNSYTMWGVDLKTEYGLDLVSWWGQVDIFTYSYAWVGDTKTIDEGLFSSIKDTDYRKSQFLDVPGHGYYLTPYNKFFAKDRIIGGQRQIEADYIYMRVAEFYLLNAEANAMLGNDVVAKNSLKDLLSQRFADATEYAYVDALSGQDLIDEVYLQTRIELWGEGKSYLAMKRNHATVTRGGNHLFLVGESIPYNDERMYFKIPQSEILNNPNID